MDTIGGVSKTGGKGSRSFEHRLQELRVSPPAFARQLIAEQHPTYPSLEPMLSGRQAPLFTVVKVSQHLVNRCREALLYVRGCQPRQLGRHFFFKLRAQQVHHAPAPAQPRFRRPPSISMRSRACGQAKSALQRRGGAKRYSRCRSGPPAASQRVAKQVSGSEILRRSCTRLNVLSKLRATARAANALRNRRR